MIRKKSGFTLAEVLVTLAIIGVVAALTIPSLMQSTQNSEIVAKVKKAQSVLSQAYTSFIADGTDMDTVFAGDAQYVVVLNKFATKLSIIKNCGNSTTIKYCFADDSDYISLNGNPNAPFFPATAILADGSSINMLDLAGGCDNHVSVDPSNPMYNTCGQILIDINGIKKPNQWGRDMFGFYVTRTGIFPYGTSDTTSCSIAGSGMSCAAKIITGGTVNY